MTKRKRSENSSRPLRRNSIRQTPSLGEQIIRGLEEGIAHLRGETQLRTRTVHVPDKIDVIAVRDKAGLSQSEFAARYGFSLRTLQEWEQGRTCPDSAVRAYLVVIDRNPRAVERALAG